MSLSKHMETERIGAGLDLLRIPNKSEYDFGRKEGEEISLNKHTEAEMIGALKQLEAGRKAEDVAREVGVGQKIPSPTDFLTKTLQTGRNGKEQRCNQSNREPAQGGHSRD
jgi:hypothetical protein